MLVDLEWLCAVVARHCPTFYLHPADAYMPCSAEFFLQNSELRQQAGGGAPAVLLPRGAVAGPLLLEAQAAAPAGARLWLELDPAARVGEPKADLGAVPVYAHPKAVVGPDGEVEALEITYVTIYPFNGPYKVGGAPFLQTGAHDGDIEHITVRASPIDGALLGVWYNAHRPRDGCWAAAPQVPRAPDGSIAAYVALHGHGVYPRPGRIPRHFLLGNDLCSDRGPVWRPRRVVLLPPLRADAADAAEAAAGSADAAAGPEAGSSVALDSVPADGASPADGVAASLQALQLDSRQAEQTSLQPSEQQPPEQQQPGQQQQQQQAKSRPRRLHVVPSRGSYLATANGGAGCCADPPLTSSPTAGDAAVAADGSALPAVDTQQACEWLRFSGDWGGDGPPGPAFQSWYHAAECPVSRSPWLRVVGHLVKEVERV